MKLWKLVTITTALAFTLNVNASLIDNGSYTTDDVSGLDWLDLSSTAGQSYSDAPTYNPGWRYATNLEIENLFGILFDGYYDTHPTGASSYLDGGYSDSPEDVINFQLLFGITGENERETFNIGMYRDENSVIRMLNTSTYMGDYIIAGLDASVEFPDSLMDDSVASFLVRTSVVPIPPAVWLFSSGLIGLIGLAKRKVS